MEFHSIADLRIHHTDLANIFVQYGLPQKLVPTKIKPHDAYRRATKSAESAIKIDRNGKQLKARLLVREVKSDSNLVIRHLVREVVDEKDVKLYHDTVGEMILDRKTNLLDTSVYHAFANEYPYDRLMNGVLVLYKDYCEYHNRETFNNIVRRLIDSMHNISILENGRATFIPRSKRSQLDAFVDVVADLAPYHTDSKSKSVVEIIPIIDTAEQRKMIADRIEQDIHMNVDDLMGNFIELLDGDRDVSLRSVQRYAQKFVLLDEKLNEYEEIVHQKMDVIRDQLSHAMSRIKIEEEQRTK